MTRTVTTMTNPDVTNAEEIAAWKWIAAITLIAALVAAVVLGPKATQRADVDPMAVPPIAATPPNT
jgi:hypothetical protein